MRVYLQGILLHLGTLFHVFQTITPTAEVVKSLLSFDSLNQELTPQMITVFGYLFSSMAIAVHAFIHFTTDLFRNLPGHMLMSNCLLLLLQYLFSTVYLTLNNNHSSWEKNVKDILDKSDYYFTAYIWAVLTRVQFVMAYDLWRCLRTQTTNIRFASQQMYRFVQYQLFCWLSPFAELAFLWALKWLVVDKLGVTCAICGGNTLKPVLFVFFIVDFVLMLANFSFYACCLYYIHKTRSQVKSATKHTGSFVFYWKICGRLFIMSEVNYCLLIAVYHFEAGDALKHIFTWFMAYHGFIVFIFIVLQKSLLTRTIGPGKFDSDNTTGTGVTSGGTTCVAKMNTA